MTTLQHAGRYPPRDCFTHVMRSHGCSHAIGLPRFNPVICSGYAIQSGRVLARSLPHLTEQVSGILA